MEIIFNEKAQNRIQQVYNQSSKLMNSSQTIEERNKAFDLFLSLIMYPLNSGREYRHRLLRGVHCLAVLGPV